jgi:hypothetical protein
MRPDNERIVREQEHRVQGLDATWAAIERIVREQEWRGQAHATTLANCLASNRRCVCQISAAEDAPVRHSVGVVSSTR